MLEAIEDEPDMKPSSSQPANSAASRAAQRPLLPDKPSSRTVNPSPPAWRPPGILGRLLGLPPQPAARNTPSNDATQSRSAPRGGPNAGGNVVPNSDTATKRRIEKQILESLGDRVRSVEVRVNGRNVLIVAKPSRFWQKRSIRRTLETLPALDGFRARIDVAD